MVETNKEMAKELRAVICAGLLQKDQEVYREFFTSKNPCKHVTKDDSMNLLMVYIQNERRRVTKHALLQIFVYKGFKLQHRDYKDWCALMYAVDCECEPDVLLLLV